MQPLRFQWAAVKQYFLYLPTYLDAGNYAYFFLMNSGEYPELVYRPWLAPGMTVAEFKNLTAPLFEDWAKLGIGASPEFYEYDTFLPAFNDAFLLETVAANISKGGSRLVPR